MDAHRRRLLLKSWTRTIHIYVSMLGLLAVIFFSVTGIMLNHEEWFGFEAPRIVHREGTLPEAMAREPDKLAIVEKLRKDFGATGAMDSFEIEEDRLHVVFKSPGRRTEAALSGPTGMPRSSSKRTGSPAGWRSCIAAPMRVRAGAGG